MDLGMIGTMGRSSRAFNARASDVGISYELQPVLAGHLDGEPADDPVSYRPKEIDGSPVGFRVHRSSSVPLSPGCHL